MDRKDLHLFSYLHLWRMNDSFLLSEQFDFTSQIYVWLQPCTDTELASEANAQADWFWMQNSNSIILISFGLAWIPDYAQQVFSHMLRSFSSGNVCFILEPLIHISVVRKLPQYEQGNGYLAQLLHPLWSTIYFTWSLSKITELYARFYSYRGINF